VIKLIKRIIPVLFVLALFFQFSIFESTAQTSSLNYDKGIELAQKLALEGNYEVARLVCQRILRDVPDYIDAYLISGNSYVWENKHDSAKMYYYKVFEFDNGNLSAFNQLIQIELCRAGTVCSFHAKF